MIVKVDGSLLYIGKIKKMPDGSFSMCLLITNNNHETDLDLKLDITSEMFFDLRRDMDNAMGTFVR